MQGSSGKLEGKGVVRDKHGNIKSEFTITTEVTPEQAAALGVDKPAEVESDGSNTPNSGS